MRAVEAPFGKRGLSITVNAVQMRIVTGRVHRLSVIPTVAFRRGRNSAGSDDRLQSHPGHALESIGQLVVLGLDREHLAHCPDRQAQTVDGRRMPAPAAIATTPTVRATSTPRESS